MEKTEYQFKVKLRPAEPGDFGNPERPAIGEIFYLKNSGGEFEGPYSLRPGQLTSKEFIAWWKNRMIYIGTHHLPDPPSSKS